MYWTLEWHKNPGKSLKNPEKYSCYSCFFFQCHACFVLIIACDFCRNLIQLSKSINPTHEFRFMYMPYLRHYKPRLLHIFFTPFFTVVYNQEWLILQTIYALYRVTQSSPKVAIICVVYCMSKVSDFGTDIVTFQERINISN